MFITMLKSCIRPTSPICIVKYHFVFLRNSDFKLFDGCQISDVKSRYSLRFGSILTECFHFDISGTVDTEKHCGGSFECGEGNASVFFSLKLIYLN